MNTGTILTEIDREIARLQEVRALLAGTEGKARGRAVRVW